MSQRSKPVPLRLSLAVIMSLTMNAPLLAQAQTATAQRASAQQPAFRPTPTPVPTPTEIESPRVANRQILNWLKEKEASATEWMGTRSQPNGMPDFLDYYIVNKNIPLSPMSDSEARIAANTKALYDEYFPREELSSFVGTFFESGNPHVDTPRGPYQWDSQKVIGLDEPGVFEAAVKNVVASGIKSIRIGPNLFEIKEGVQSWQNFVERIETIWEAGATPTISVAFFPSLERWKKLDANGNLIESESFLLNRDWPADMAKMTTDMMVILNAKAARFERTTGKKARFVVNPINEPETLAGFNRQFWHGAYANWSSPLMMKYYVPSVINIAKANVAIRQAVENKSDGKRILFMHNEAMTPTYYPSHKGPGRFAVSKFMLGDDQILKTNFDKDYLSVSLQDLKDRLEADRKAKNLNEVEWAFKEFVFGSWNKSTAQQEEARVQLVNQFKDLQAAHLKLASSTGKTMKTDNMLWMDYYYQTEFIINRPIPQLIQYLGANQSAMLKYVLDVKDDATMLRMVRSAIGEIRKKLPGFNPLSEDATAANTDMAQVLAAEDSALFEHLIGIRNEYSFTDSKNAAARRAHFSVFKGKLFRTDELLTQVLAKKAAKLKTILRAKTDEQLITVLQQFAQDTSDGGVYVELTGNETLREILNKNDRKILERVFGIRRERLLGFEPNHYARHIRLGIRDGFYKYAMEYINNLRLHTVGVGESGTPFYVFAPLLHDQVMMEYAHVLKSGVYGTQYAFGPAVDTKGWAKGPLSLHYQDDNETNPSGLFSIVKGKGGLTVKERSFVPDKPGWARSFLSDFFGRIRGK